MEKRKYTREFRQQAIDLAASLGSAGQAAQQLGIPESNIHNWRSRMKLRPSGSGKLGPEAAPAGVEELERLRRENAELKKVNHILKAAAAFFSQDHLK